MRHLFAMSFLNPESSSFHLNYKLSIKKAMEKIFFLLVDCKINRYPEEEEAAFSIDCLEMKAIVGWHLGLG